MAENSDVGGMDDCEHLAPAWHSAVMAAFQDNKAHAAFRGATGRPQASKTHSPLDAMIDRAIGGQIDDAYMHEFIDWFTINFWGEEFAPRAWRKRHKQKA